MGYGAKKEAAPRPPDLPRAARLMISIFRVKPMAHQHCLLLRHSNFPKATFVLPTRDHKNAKNAQPNRSQ